jgi:hypothetical protein
MSGPGRVPVDEHLPLKPLIFHILLALAEEERHGYAIMREVRERSGGHIRLETGPLYRHLTTAPPLTGTISGAATIGSRRWVEPSWQPKRSGWPNW